MIRLRLKPTPTHLMRTIPLVSLALMLAALAPGASAQAACDPSFTDTDYSLYALDAAVAGDFETAEALYACWEEASPESASVYLDRAAVRAELQGDFDGALADLERAEDLSGANSIVSIRRLKVMLAMGDFEEAVRLAEILDENRSLRILGEEGDPLRRAAYRGLGIALVDEGRYEAALEALEIAVERMSEEDLTPADAPLVLAISEAFRNTGQLEQAAQGYTAYVEFMGDAADPEIVALVEALEENGVSAFFAVSTVLRAELATEARVTGAISPFRFSPDGRMVGVFMGLEGAVQIYDTRSGAPLALIRGAYHLPGLYAFNSDGSRIAVIRSRGELTLYDTSTGEVVSELPIAEDRDRPTAVAFDGDELIALFSSGAVRRYDMATGDARSQTSLAEPVRGVPGAFFSADAGAVALVDGESVLFSLSSGRQTAELDTNGWPIYDWTGDLRFAVTQRSDRVAIWTTAFGGGEIQRFEFEADLSRNVAVDDAGETLIVGDENGLLTAIELLTGARSVVGFYSDEIEYVDISPDGQLAIAVDADGVLRLWEVHAGD